MIVGRKMKARHIILRVRHAMRNQPCCSQVQDVDEDVQGWPEELSIDNLLQRIVKSVVSIQLLVKAEHQIDAIAIYSGAYPRLSEPGRDIIRPLLNSVFIDSVRAINIPPAVYQTLEASGRFGSATAPVAAYGSGRLRTSPPGGAVALSVILAQEKITLSDYNLGNDDLVLSVALTEAVVQHVMSGVYETLSIPVRSQLHNRLYIDEVTPYLTSGSNVTVERLT